MNGFWEVVIQARRALGMALASFTLAGGALAAPVLMLEIAGGNALTVGQSANASLVVTGLGADEVVTVFDVSLDIDQAIAAVSNLAVNEAALDTDSANSGASLSGNGFSFNFFGFTNAGVFNNNNFTDLKALQGGASGTFTLASFVLQGVSVGNSIVAFGSPFIFGIETAATFGTPLDLGDNATSPLSPITVTGAGNPVPAPGALALFLLGLAASAGATKRRRT